MTSPISTADRRARRDHFSGPAAGGIPRCDVAVDTIRMNANPIITAEPESSPVSPLWQQAAAVRYGVNWQWTAIKMQYERLMARPTLSPGDLVEHAMHEHMRGVIDMDFLVTAVRRFLRVADQAKRSGCDSKGELKIAIKIFMSRWSHVIDARNSLEHFDQPGSGLVPAQSSNSEARWQFATSAGSIDMQRLFGDAEKLCKIILKVIDPFKDWPLLPVCDRDSPVGSARGVHGA